MDTQHITLEAIILLYLLKNRVSSLSMYVISGLPKLKPNDTLHHFHLRHYGMKDAVT